MYVYFLDSAMKILFHTVIETWNSIHFKQKLDFIVNGNKSDYDRIYRVE